VRHDALKPLSDHGRPLELAQSVIAVWSTAASGPAMGKKNGFAGLCLPNRNLAGLCERLGQSAFFGPRPVNAIRAIAGRIWFGAPSKIASRS
jgi:hypothetical protein